MNGTLTTHATIDPLHTYTDITHGVYVGDFPPVHWPTQPLNPCPRDIWPPHNPQPYLLDPNITITTVWPPPQPSAWRVTLGNDRITATIDLPGVRLADLQLDVGNGQLSVTAKRFDTGETTVHAHQVGNGYDWPTATATLEAGVLTVVVMKSKAAQLHRVVVAAK